MANENAVAQQQQEKGLMTYDVAGQTVKLSFQIVRDYLTKGNGQVSDQELVGFMQICKYNQLNPFLNEAYLIKYGSSPATMVVSKEAFFKRAEANQNYDGIQAGVIVIRDNQVLELEGTFYMPGDKLVGGWAKVYRSDKKFPFVSKVNLSEYDKGQSNWKEKPSTMIRKVAEVQALREAFPAQLGALYTAEEQTNVIDVKHEEVSSKVNDEIAKNANKKTINIDDAQPEPQQEDKQAQPQAESAPQATGQPAAKVGEGGLFAGTAADAKKANEQRQRGF